MTTLADMRKLRDSLQETLDDCDRKIEQLESSVPDKPWRVIVDGWFVRSNTDLHVAHASRPEYAAEIVRCVNSHATLVAACERAITVVSVIGEHEVANELRSAVALAKEPR